MNTSDPERHQRQRLDAAVRQDCERLETAERERRTVLGYTVFMGTIAGLFVVPVIAGAYLGRWLDDLATGYSVRWTVSLILLGVLFGAVNVYRFVRDHP